MTTKTTAAIETIRAIHTEKRGSLDLAARTFRVRHPSLARCVIDDVGLHPSSEPEIAALQRVWR